MALDGEMQRLLEKVAKAGSWSVWMGVFDRGWMELLQAGGMSYVRARRLTKRLCNVIRESEHVLQLQHVRVEVFDDGDRDRPLDHRKMPSPLLC